MILHSKIRIDGCEVIPVPLFNVLDGKRSEDYIARVEPSSSGGKKMAEYFLDIIEHPIILQEAVASANSAPIASFISGRK